MRKITPALLKSFSFFSSFSATQRRHIAEHATAIHYAEKTTIFHAGEYSDKMYLIRAGRVKIARADDQAGEIVLGLLDAGQVFGELAMLSGEPRMATATTLTPCDFLVVNRALIAQAITMGTPNDLLKLLASFSQQIRAVNEREFQDLLARRTAELQREIQLLRIEIDQVRRQRQVAEIVDSDFFQHVQTQAQILRARRDAHTHKDED
jgi:CRP-like cAMP-binding protein